MPGNRKLQSVDPAGRNCSTCKNFLPWDCFYPRKGRDSGLSAYCSSCKTCNRIKTKKWIEQYGFENHIQRHYGMTLDDWNYLIKVQDGKCAICRSEFDKRVSLKVSSRFSRLSVDHNHQTNKVRGLLCNSCNQGLGLFEENPEFLRNAAIYIEERK